MQFQLPVEFNDKSFFTMKGYLSGNDKKYSRMRNDKNSCEWKNLKNLKANTV